MKKLTILIALVAIWLPTSVLYAQKSKLSVTESEITWTGKKVTGSHTGTIKLLSGYLEKSGEDFVDGKFVVDMTSISDKDIDDPKTRAKLEGHLKSSDFFSVDEYPTATLFIENGEKTGEGTYQFSGKLTIKGNTNPVSFEAKAEGSTFNGKLVIDRAKYNVRYGSGSFFENLGDNLIYDDFELVFNVTFE